MFSTLTLSPCPPSPHVPPGYILRDTCSTETFDDDNGPYCVGSPQYKLPPPSPLPELSPLRQSFRAGNSVKLDDGRSLTIAWHLSPTVRRKQPRSELRVCADDISSPPPPSLLRKLIDAFISLPPAIFQRP